MSFTIGVFLKYNKEGGKTVMPHKGIKKEGVALIVVLVMIIIFASLILAVILSSTIAIRRAHYYKDKLIALQIAESGMNKILYKMNYEKYGNDPSGTLPSDFQHKYPFGGGGTRVPIDSNSVAIDTEIDVSEWGPEARCFVRLIDVINEDTDEDELIVKGKYKGRVVTIRCKIRGSNIAGTCIDYAGDLDGKNYPSLGRKVCCGIPEAFNKHAIYAYQIEGNGNVELKGNITYETTYFTGSFTPGSEVTWVETKISLPEISAGEFLTEPSFSTSGKDIFGYGGYGVLHNGTVLDLTSGIPRPYQGGTVEYDPSKPAYIFHNISPSSLEIEVGTDTDVADCELDRGTFINTKITAAKRIIIRDDITLETTIFYPSWKLAGIQTVPFSIDEGKTVNGDLIVIYSKGQERDFGTIVTTDTDILHDVTINGCIFTNIQTLDIGDNVTINASGSSFKSAIIIKRKAWRGTINVKSPLTVILGENQCSVFFIYSHDQHAATVDVNINGSIVPVDENGRKVHKFLIISKVHQNLSGIKINVPGGEVYGGIYADYFFKDVGHNRIILEDGTLYGMIVTSCTVELKGGRLFYDGAIFKNYKKYSGLFQKGRRVYIPVPGSLRIEW